MQIREGRGEFAKTRKSRARRGRFFHKKAAGPIAHYPALSASFSEKRAMPLRAGGEKSKNRCFFFPRFAI